MQQNHDSTKWTVPQVAAPSPCQPHDGWPRVIFEMGTACAAVRSRRNLCQGGAEVAIPHLSFPCWRIGRRCLLGSSVFSDPQERQRLFWATLAFKGWSFVTKRCSSNPAQQLWSLAHPSCCVVVVFSLVPWPFCCCAHSQCVHVWPTSPLALSAC